MRRNRWLRTGGLILAATLVVALVLIVSAGLVRSGAVLLITRSLVNPDRASTGRRHPAATSPCPRLHLLLTENTTGGPG
ncbi:MAG: hypothetical protein AAF317_00920, partial [Pseudomonadota bacterium]